MGGNALSVATIRLPASAYHQVSQKVLHKLQIAYPGRKIVIIPSYTNKPDFGDLDILIESGTQEGKEYDPKSAFQALGATELVRNGDVTSLGYKLKESVFQVDLIKIKPEAFNFTLRYFSFNDLGNLIGRIAHKAGFKLGHDGLRYVLRDKQESDHVIDELIVTRNFDEALSFLGYDPKQYQDGFNDGFKLLTDVFQFVTTTPYFNRDIYLLENRNAKSRVRDRKRKTYMGFLDWLEKIPHNALPTYDWNDKKVVRQTFLGNALSGELFQEESNAPVFVKSYNAAIVKYHQNNRIKAKFNGRLVGELTGLSGKELGGLMMEIRNSFVSKEAMQKWMLKSKHFEIEALIKRVASQDSGNTFRADPFLLNQQAQIRLFMQTLGMSRSQFAAFIGVTQRRLNNWLLPVESPGYRKIDKLILDQIVQKLHNAKSVTN